MATDKARIAPRTLVHLGLFLALLTAASFGSRLTLNDFDKQHYVAGIARQLALALCSNDLRLPSVPCPQSPSLIKRRQFLDNESFAHSFSRLPDMPAVISRLVWPDGSEADAARLLAIIRTLELSRRNDEAVDPTADLLSRVWQRYPQLVAASACVSCGEQEDILAALLERNHANPEELQPIFIGNSALMRVYDQTIGIEQDVLETLARIHAYLGHTPHSKPERYIGALLWEMNAVNELRAWAERGIGTLYDLELDSVPQDIVIKAWRSSLESGFSLPGSTGFLMAHGYRPALRLLLWFEGAELTYLESRNYKFSQDEYRELVDRHTNFSDRSGTELAEFYNGNWRDIQWDANTRAWKLNP